MRAHKCMASIEASVCRVIRKPTRGCTSGRKSHTVHRHNIVHRERKRDSHTHAHGRTRVHTRTRARKGQKTQRIIHARRENIPVNTTVRTRSMQLSTLWALPGTDVSHPLGPSPFQARRNSTTTAARSESQTQPQAAIRCKVRRLPGTSCLDLS